MWGIWDKIPPLTWEINVLMSEWVKNFIKREAMGPGGEQGWGCVQFRFIITFGKSQLTLCRTATIVECEAFPNEVQPKINQPRSILLFCAIPILEFYGCLTLPVLAALSQLLQPSWSGVSFRSLIRTDIGVHVCGSGKIVLGSVRIRHARPSFVKCHLTASKFIPEIN